MEYTTVWHIKQIVALSLKASFFIHDKWNMASTLIKVYMELLLKIPADVSIDWFPFA